MVTKLKEWLSDTACSQTYPNSESYASILLNRDPVI